MHVSTLLAIVPRTCSSPEVILAFLLYEGSSIHNVSDQFISCVYFFFVDSAFYPSPQTSDLYAPASNSCIFTPIENWTHVNMNLFTRNSPYYHLLKYLLFLQKQPVYISVLSSFLCVFESFCIFQILDLHIIFGFNITSHFHIHSVREVIFWVAVYIRKGICATGSCSMILGLKCCW